MADDMLVFNGVNGATGQYDLPPMPVEEFAAFIRQAKSPRNLPELRFRYQQRGQKYLNVSVGMNPRMLDQTGWGLILPHDAPSVLLDALAELIDWRRRQAGDYFQIYNGERGYQPGETKESFLSRHNVYLSVVDPSQMPFYLLLVGSPEEIPYEFQNELDVGYAVGRLHFDMPEQYANYAASVVAAERGEIDAPRRAALFAPVHENDQWSHLSRDSLVEPLFKRVHSSRSEWDFGRWSGHDANKANLARLLGGDLKPSLLFTATHGLTFPAGDPRQAQAQGALICQEWSELSAGTGALRPEHYFAASDLADDADLRGQIVFCYGSYGAGAPRDDESAGSVLHNAPPIAPQSAVAPLAKRLLGRPRGALALIGQVGRTWSYAFDWSGSGAQTTVYESTLLRLLSGDPAGFAAEYFDERYAEMASDLNDTLEQASFGASIDPNELVGIWTASNDMRSHVVLGDPAVRLLAAAT